MSGVEAPARAVERRIRKDPAALSPRPNLFDYTAERSHFDWAGAWKLLDGLLGGTGLARRVISMRRGTGSVTETSLRPHVGRRQDQFRPRPSLFATLAMLPP
jgi:hypothetical protein